MSNYLINILPFNLLKEQVDVFFSKNEKKGYYRIYNDNLPKNMDTSFVSSIDKFAWWSVNRSNDGSDLQVSVNLAEEKWFAKDYFNTLVFDHFYEQKIITSRNFVNDTEIYLEDVSYKNDEYKKYHVFTLRIDSNALIKGLSLLVAYDGNSFLLNNSIEKANISNSLLGKICYKKKITKFNLLSEEEQQDRDEIYPILNRGIKSFLKLPYERNYSENKYKKYYDQILWFYKSYLSGKVVGECIKILESGFYQPYRINATTEESNLLLFGDNHTNYIPYIGLKEYGPLKPYSDKPVKFIFVFHEDDKDLANRVYSYFKKGYKSFPGLQSFVKINFEVDKLRSIQFTKEDPISEITTAIQGLQSNPETAFSPDNSYVAIYISRIIKNSGEEEIDQVYYKLKELLLHYEITSQVIYRNNIDNPSFNFFLPNIAIALLAKLGGIPWRLYRPIKNDLVIGIGADRSMSARNKYVGNAFCFTNDGSFIGFNAFEKNNADALADSIKGAITEYLLKNKGADRLVIHYYKKMSKAEEKPIRNVLHRLNLSLPYVILTINNTLSKDYVLFDNLFDGKMPQSGTFIKIKWNEFILCNNTRYSKYTGTKIESFPLPIKIKFKSFNYEKLDDMNVIRELIDQVYQFSRMYWKSVRQRNMPVTIEYSEIIARMIEHFENKELEPFIRNTLWFL